MFKYSVNLSWSDEDESYIALVPEFPGLSAFGDTVEEAAAEAKIAAESFIKVYKEDGCEVPEPRKLHTYSGQTRLRLPKSLHAALSQEAKDEGISLNSYILYLLSERHKANQIDKKIERIDNILTSYIFLHSLKFQTDSPEVQAETTAQIPTYKGSYYEN